MLFHLIAADIRAKASMRTGNATPRHILRTIASDGTLCMVLYRLTQAARRRRLRILELMLSKFTNWSGGCLIGRGADFGPGFVLIHSNGVVINANVRGGSNIQIEHQVTIGSVRRESPVLGDDVFVGAGAKVIGPVTVGDGAQIGANAVVVKDVPPATTVVGVPAKPVTESDPGNT